MKEASELESGVQRSAVDGAGPLSDEALIEACRDLLEAASALILNVELLASEQVPNRAAIVEDARSSVHRLAKIVHGLRQAAGARQASKVG